jgi:hypothetical protein
MGSSASKYMLKIYDPRKGEDLRIDLGGGKTFSTLRNGFLGIDIPKLHNLAALGHSDDVDVFIRAALLKQAGMGFFSFTPLTKKVKNSGVIDLNNVDNLSDSILGYFGIDVSSIEQAIETHRKVISYEEWVIGSCREMFEKPIKRTRWYKKVIVWDINYILLQAEKINCLYYYNGEMDMCTILTQMFEGLDDLLLKLVES